MTFVSSKAFDCAKEAAQAVDHLTIINSASPLHYDNYKGELNNRAKANVAGHIGNLVFDECMAGEPVTPKATPVKAPEAAPAPAK